MMRRDLFEPCGDLDWVMIYAQQESPRIHKEEGKINKG